MATESTFLLVQFVSVLVMVGIIWFVQIVHYPLFDHVGAEQFSQFARSHQTRTTAVVLGPMLLEAGTALGLVAISERIRGSWSYWFALAVLAVIWGSTVLLQVPLHRRLALRYDSTCVRRLIQTNWIRTIGWTVRGIVLLILVRFFAIP